MSAPKADPEVIGSAIKIPKTPDKTPKINKKLLIQNENREKKHCNFSINDLVEKVTDQNNYNYDLARKLDVSSKTISNVLEFGETQAFRGRAEILLELHDARYRCEDILSRAEFGSLPTLKNETEQERREKFKAELDEMREEFKVFDDPEIPAKEAVLSLFKQRAMALNAKRAAEKDIQLARQKKIESLDKYVEDLSKKVQALTDVHDFLESFQLQFRETLGEDITNSEALSEKRQLESDEFEKKYKVCQKSIKKIIEKMKKIIWALVHSEEAQEEEDRKKRYGRS